jgi:hypothetical protein
MGLPPDFTQLKMSPPIAVRNHTATLSFVYAMPVKSHASQARVSFKGLLSGFQFLFVMPAPWKISHSSMGGIQASFDFKTF